MAELTKEDVKDAVREAMAEKLEMTFGIDCREPEERAEMRKDHEFLRSARLGKETLARKILLVFTSLISAGALYLAAIGLKDQVK